MYPNYLFVMHSLRTAHFPCAPPSSAGWSGDVGED